MKPKFVDYYAWTQTGVVLYSINGYLFPSVFHNRAHVLYCYSVKVRLSNLSCFNWGSACRGGGGGRCVCASLSLYIERISFRHTIWFINAKVINVINSAVPNYARIFIYILVYGTIVLQSRLRILFGVDTYVQGAENESNESKVNA